VPAVYRPCAVCRDEKRRTAAGIFPVATFMAEVTAGQAPVCREHLAMLRRPGVLVKGRPLEQPPPRKPGQVYRVAHRYPKPANTPRVPIPVPNAQTIAISGVYT
jgi:hypothetical protein